MFIYIYILDDIIIVVINTIVLDTFKRLGEISAYNLTLKK